jgi:hypothetical protein
LGEIVSTTSNSKEMFLLACQEDPGIDLYWVNSILSLQEIKKRSSD